MSTATVNCCTTEAVKTPSTTSTPTQAVPATVHIEEAVVIKSTATTEKTKLKVKTETESVSGSSSLKVKTTIKSKSKVKSKTKSVVG